jgi:hypothetical protein
LPANAFATVSLKAVFDAAGLEYPKAFLEADDAAKKDATGKSETSDEEIVIETLVGVLGWLQEREN